MMGSSKILTVSYGTFSCTLEGFDDSFGTMKAIAEYFQQLASEDRYFGAEPATPDADMLAHIASSEIKRKVSAKVEDGNVTLRPGITAHGEKDTPDVAVEGTQVEDAIESVQTEEPAKEEIAPVKAELVEKDLADTDHAPLETGSVSTESVAAKLRRIRAVVAQNKGDISSGTEFAEDQHANGFIGGDETAETATPEPEYQVEEDIAELATKPDTNVSIEDIVEDTPNEYFEDEIEEIAEQVVPDAEIEAVEDNSDAALDNIMDAMNVSDDDAENVTDELEEPFEDVAEYQELSGIEDDFEDEIEASETDIMKNVQGTLGKTSLSAEDEAHLVSELADIELENETAEVDHEGLDRGINSLLRSERADRALGTNENANTDASVERLLDETNAKLETDDSTRRRSVISHLRAAVAATVADGKESHEDNEPVDEAELYRLDLADAVKPELPTAEPTQPAAPVKPGRPVIARKRRIERPSPLVLVSEQRVDEADEAPAEPTQADPVKIRPRRILKSAPEVQEQHIQQDEPTENLLTAEQHTPQDGENIFADSTSFADFAEKMGATSMPDILEAAAAYNAFVEGQPDFGRPQIMRQVASYAGKEQFDREEGLRSFGQLLRQGKIIKVNRGRFEIADTTRFKPAERYAGE